VPRRMVPGTFTALAGTALFRYFAPGTEPYPRQWIAYAIRECRDMPDLMSVFSAGSLQRI